jgi:YVTN family beta-propeller protein
MISTPFSRLSVVAARSTACSVALLCAGLLSASCKGSPAPPQTATPAAQTAAPPAPPVNPNGPRIYVSDETGRDVVVIDPDAGQVVGRIEVGKRPRGLRLSKDGKQLFIALSGSPIGGPGVDESKLPPADRAADGIGVVDIASGKLVRKFTSGPDPESFDISPDGKFLYVSNEDAAEMSALDLASGEITHRVKVGEEPEGVTVRPDGRVVYVTSEGDNAVVAIDTTTYKVVGKIATAPRPRSMVFTPDNKLAFVATENGNAVNVVDAQKHRVLATLKIPQTDGTPTPPRPMGTAMSPDAREVFVSFGRAKSVGVIDVATRKLARTFEDVGARPWGIGVSPDGRKIYTANGPSGDVSIVDIATGTVEKRVKVGGSPWGVAVAQPVTEGGATKPAAPSPPGGR